MSEIRKLHMTVMAEDLRPNDKIIRRAPDVGLFMQFDIIREEKIETKRFYLEALDGTDMVVSGPYMGTDGYEFFTIGCCTVSYDIPTREFISYLGAIYPQFIRPEDEWDDSE